MSKQQLARTIYMDRLYPHLTEKQILELLHNLQKKEKKNVRK